MLYKNAIQNAIQKCYTKMLYKNAIQKCYTKYISFLR